MFGRPPAFIRATSVTCMLLVGGDRIAEYNELFADAGLPDLTIGQMKDIAHEVKDSSTSEEKKILNTLLHDRLNWHPEAPDLLAHVTKRGRRLAECSSMKNQSACTGMKKGCGGCKWANSSFGGGGSCSAPQCSGYKDSSSCCANAMKVDNGCFWQKSNYRNKSFCVPMKCDSVAKGMCSNSFSTDCPEAKTACKAQKGCTYFDNVGKCVDSNMNCTGDKSSMVCSSGNAGGGLMEAMSCPLTTCQTCLSLCMTGDCKATYKKDLEGKCANDCKGVIHCADEAMCLKGKVPDTTCDQKGSCVAELKHETESTTCAETCTAFDTKCQTCGEKTTCAKASSSGTARVAPFASVVMSCIAAVCLAAKH